MLPPPSLSFVLPSLHDGTPLDCRVYHPAVLSGPLSPWPGHAAVVAHPYAPLGGCFDDPVVALLAAVLVQRGFVVATFNFRGASSAGTTRTSWTSRPERSDYMAVVGFLTHYVHYLLRATPTSQEEVVPETDPVLVLAGYSYGAMVTAKLPPLDAVLHPFVSPPVESPAADIRLRAQHLAEQQRGLLAAAPQSPRRSLGMRTGGEERRNQDAEGREERIRRGVKELLARTKLVKSTARADGVHDQAVLDCVPDLVAPRATYLLVSPPVGVLTTLATMSLPEPVAGWSQRLLSRTPFLSGMLKHGDYAEEQRVADTKLVRNPTLVIYGDQDGFVTYRRMRDWAKSLGDVEGSRFRHVEVAGAGHFWVEEGAVYGLRDSVEDFVAGLVVGKTGAGG
ncbi:Alpha/Beta hydrolase protein [Xylariomycetidae sp. FL0641]|nr:Alpha/Beta hydrolase protein [Xylariomycetidae sp. FL0641]